MTRYRENSIMDKISLDNHSLENSTGYIAFNIIRDKDSWYVTIVKDGKRSEVKFSGELAAELCGNFTCDTLQLFKDL
jgi:hypothetical protein